MIEFRAYRYRVSKVTIGQTCIAVEMFTMGNVTKTITLHPQWLKDILDEQDEEAMDRWRNRVVSQYPLGKIITEYVLDQAGHDELCKLHDHPVVRPMIEQVVAEWAEAAKQKEQDAGLSQSQV